ncbi:penicillin-binding protein 1C [Aureimonas endophytica]|uniref:peptidoglycan glycosyltransferase n=1 Tax=Aureimonas endophytica TaxID=2027858 RepID=A0A916ZR54_9HYPH|nr:penicillin-binding protein 1C [Aureimonas endophytica]GGE10168.1 penicillin-binding protein 1C [Aureimonas endophytica]
MAAAEERLREPDTGTLVVDREGAILRAFAAPDGRWRLEAGVEAVDPRYLAMLLAWEDKRFFAHGGIDGRAVLRALWQSARHGRVVAGGSTLTMQVARLLERLPTGSLAAKWDQAVGAAALERGRTKEDILGLYLRLAPYGGNLEGVRAASLAWFGKEPRRLTAGEAALLVALPQAPERVRPDLYPGAAKRARDRVLARMAELGILAPEEARRAAAEPLPAGRRAMPRLAAHAAERARQAHPEARRIALTLDAALQARVETYARARVAAMDKPLSLAVLVSDHATGEVLAALGSPDLLDAGRQGHVDLTRAPRSPGSTLKPLIYGLAFERGVAHPESLVDDRPTGFAGYAPQNFDHAFEGVITARRALQLSRNLPAIALLQAVGPSRLVQRLRRAGAAPELGDRSLPGLAIGLGGLGLSLRDLVALYGAIADGGVARPLREEAGAAPALAQGAGARVLSPQAAWYVTSILAGGSATVKASPGTIAHKTGTSFGYRDAWSLGYDGRHVVGVWIGRPDGAPVPGLVGQDAAVPVMRDVFSRIGPETRLPGPPPGILAVPNGALPPPLRMFGQPAGMALAETAPRPEIVFPPNATRIDLGLAENAGAELALKLRNGTPPFTWYVDGAPVERGRYDRQAAYRPAEPGFLDISVVDAKGAAASARVFVD